jgi:succinate-acetate transporter protein
MIMTVILSWITLSASVAQLSFFIFLKICFFLWCLHRQWRVWMRASENNKNNNSNNNNNI